MMNQDGTFLPGEMTQDLGYVSVSAIELVYLIIIFCINMTPHVNYCNSVLSSAPKKVTDKLQHGLPRLMHWLVIPQQVQYNLAVTVHRCLCNWAPRYLADYCVSVSEVFGRQHLRSARCHQLSVLRVCHSTFGTCAFFVAGPTVWNSLPGHFHDPAVDSKQFRRELKTSLFAGHLKH